MATVSQGCPMVTIPLPLDYQQHKIDDMVDNSVVPLHHPAASEQAVTSAFHDGSMTDAFSLAGHEYSGTTSCTQQTPVMTAVPYQTTPSSSSPVVVEMALTRQLGAADRMKRKRKKVHNHEQGMDSALSNSTCVDYTDNQSLLTTTGEVYVTEPQAVDSSLAQTDTPPQKLTWQAFSVETWATMCDSALDPINSSGVEFLVEAEKGFFYSPVDECFVCQKKNHFQVTVELKMPQTPSYLTTPRGEVESIEKFALHLHGIKFEAANSIIQIEQSKPDRTKAPYNSIPIEISAEKNIRVSACRLHFSETTANNMRKRGKPNPDQRHFALVVSVHAYTQNGHYPVISHVSERIIVRASNPGNFDNDVDCSWARGVSTDSICHFGKIGVNTDSPEEALSVVGNIQVSGQILQPSDVRLKTDIVKLNTAQMLDNVSKLNLYQYRFRNEGEHGMGLRMGKVERRREVGLLAQEVETVIPEAVHHTTFHNGELLLLNKDRVLMECVGAIQELTRLIAQRLQ